MALKVRDRVKETTTTTGTGSISLAGAVTGFRSFSSVLSTNDTCYYAIVGTGEFEVGLGTLSNSTTLARTTVISSSNSNSAVNFSAGSKDVFITQPATKAVLLNAAGNVHDITTTNLSEGTNQYYTDTKADARIANNIIDEDSFATDSATRAPSQQSVKAYIAAQIQTKDNTDEITEGSSNLYHTSERVQDVVGAMMSSNTETGITVTYEDGDGTLDFVVASQTDNNFTNALQTKLNAIEENATADQTAAEIRTLVESATDSNVFTDADHTKLNAIEATATADQTDSEIKTAYENNADTNAFTDALLSKLNAIENSATADQSDSEIKTAYENNSDTNAFTDALLSKLNAIESGATADQTSEEIQDIVGAMFSSNTETGITATYQDSDGTIDLVVGTLNQNTTGNAATATKLETARTINGTSFDGTSNISFDTDAVSEGSSNLYYTDSRVETYLTNNSYATQSFVTTQISNLVDSAPGALDTLNELAAAIGDDANFATTINTSLGNRLRIDVSNQSLTSTQKTNALTNLGINASYSGNAATATALETARTIHGVSFDGTANIDLTEVIQDTVGAMFSSNTETNIVVTYQDSDGTIDLVVSTLNQDTTGNAATATALETARTIHGVSFDGTSNIDLTEVIQDTVGAMFSSNTETGITATYEDSDGTIDLAVAAQTANDFTTTLKNKLDGIESNATADQSNSEIKTAYEANSDTNAFTDALLSKLNGIEASATADQSDSEIKTAYENNSDTNAFTDALLSKLNAIEAGATADQTSEEIQDIVGAMFSSNTETGITATYQDADGTIDLVVATLNQDTTGNAGTATALETARTIQGVSFDGTANIDLTEAIQDVVGGMFSSNTETGISATYEDSDGTIDLVVATLNQDTTGNAATATALETARTIHGVSFDGTANIDLTEVIQDTVGAMFTGNTETDITATYQDSDGTIDLVVSGGGTTINNNADNRLITGSGTAGTLEAEANATWNGNTLALTAGTGHTGISLTDGSTNYGFIAGGNALKSGGSANDFSFRTDTGSIDFYTNGQNLRFAIESDGVINTSELVRIGSGSTFENEALNVKKTGSNDDAVLALDSDTGDASFYRFIRFYKKNNNDSLGKIDYDNSGDAMTLAVESDERYKTITGEASGLNLISKLEPIKYTREETGVTDGCGFSAQAYKQAFDDIGEYARGVTVGSDSEKWMLDYAPLVPNLVKAIQEQQEQIQVLQNEIQELKGAA
ncbi:MAG: hypothetical protein GOVbin1578_31 [Prokaryotic dsDNA virus sp.]|nr:MAG: hypothetical protein GOVbin1578_31 [Prokaryotic dsDNA virus sp.]|tara:strand:+ start:4328 stop:8017 length:3690 start_codon:yes stop_codon:yes gene_type:complete